MVSIMLANNEIGVIQPVENISKPSSSRNVLTAILKPGSSSTNKILDFLTGALFI